MSRYAGLTDPELNALVRDAVDLRKRNPTDDEIEGALRDGGMPAEHAGMFRRNPMIRRFATQYWFDAQAAKLGDQEAAERVDHCRGAWASLNARSPQ